MKNKIIFIYIALFYSAFFVQNVEAQTKLKAKAYVYGGYQHNIFKAPKSLFDKASDSYLSQNELLVSDFFQDLGFSANYDIDKKKYQADLNADFWYRNYTKNRNLNQSKFSLDGNLSYKLKSKIRFGVLYKLSHSNKIGTSVTGDDLTRSFIYIQNKPELFVSYKKSKKSRYYLSFSFDHKNYYKDTTSMSLNHYNLRLKLKARYLIFKKHYINLQAHFTDRHYNSYHASDSNGYSRINHPLRHFRYWGFDADYKHIIRKSLWISPYISLVNRNDLFQAYYSYFSYKVGFNTKYKIKKFNIQLGVAHKKVNYETKVAPSYDSQDPNLEYAYLSYSAKLEYKISKSFNAYAYFASDSRDTNTELEHWKTRRPYNRHEFMLGINYTFRK